MKLTDIACRNAKPGHHRDGDSKLFLLVRPDGRRFWRYRFDFGGKETLAGVIGRGGKSAEFPMVTLAEARARATEYRRMIEDGKNPIEERRTERRKNSKGEEAVRRERTFEGFARSYHAKIAGEFRNPKHERQWLSSLQPVFDKLGDRDLADITQEDLIRVLAPIFEATPETAARVRQRVKAVYDSALFRKLVTGSPAAALNTKDARIELGDRRRNKDRHFAALPFQRVPEFVKALDAYGAMLIETGQSIVAQRALLFALLCASRSGEVRGMTFDEVSADGKTWVIPASRMKIEKNGDHVVYLSDAARAIVREMRELTGGAGLVFPSPLDRERPLSDMTLLQILRRLATGATREDGKPETYGDLSTVHGLCRTCFSSWAREKAVARNDVIEACLAHRENSVAATYGRQATFAAERRALLVAWAAYVTATKPAKVVEFAARRGRA